jgi:peptidoglycan/xylan/chitin deacetylase (PgdA/CDA1 family)
MSSSCAILTYHSQNIAGQSTRDNDHVALEQDLEVLHESGIRILSISELLARLKDANGPFVEGTVCLSFDDGCDFDVRDLDYPGHGVQRSFLGIMQDFIARHGPEAQPGMHATSFVIASRAARETIDTRSLFGKGWISDDWWQEAYRSGLISIGNHGWDHNHPDLFPDSEEGGSFHSVDSREQCEQQVIRAAELIERKSGIWPELFAYPFGECSDYIRQEFFPEESAIHKCRAALGTDAGKIEGKSDRWNLPRYVCGRDWQTPQELIQLLKN